MIQSEKEYMQTAKKSYDLYFDYVKTKNGCSYDMCAAAYHIYREEKKKLVEYDNFHFPNRQGKWIPVPSGGRFWLESPRAEEVNIYDIAHNLARINRFNGATIFPYSVAQHSVYVSRLMPARLKMFGLMHDAAEAYLGDVVSPIKRLIKDFYEPLEEKVMEAIAIHSKFHLEFKQWSDKSQVKVADLTMLATEVRDLTPNRFINGEINYLPLETNITECWEPEKAQSLFLQEYEKINGTKRVTA